jgi:hypothetical protein
MGLISVITGLDTRKKTYNFTGKIRDNLNLCWDYAKLLKSGEEITPDYSVGEDDIILIQEYPGGSTGSVAWDIVVGVLTLGIIPIVNAFTAFDQLQKELDDVRSKQNAKTNSKQTTTIPFISGAKNTLAEGQAAPLLLGRHGFAPYFISNPYLKVSGTDGERLDWHGTFLVAQKDLCFEKIRLGTQVIKSFSGSEITESNLYPFDPGYFYDADNKIEICQSGLFSDPVFDEKWVDSLQSQIALDYPIVDDEENGGKKWDDSKVIVRQSAKNPCVVEIELTLEGLFAWDSKNGVEVETSAEVYVGWSTDGENYRQIPIGQFDTNNVIGIINAEDTGENIPPHSKLTRAKNKQMRFIARLDLNQNKSYLPAVLSRGEIDIKAMRCSPDGTGSTRDKVYITAIRTQVYSSNSTASALIPAKNIDARIRGKFCRMGIKIKADDRTKEGLDEFNVIASMTGRTWNGSEWSEEKSAIQNSAAVALEALTGLVHDKSKYDDDELDWKSFGDVYEFCGSQQITLGSGETKTVELQANGYLTKTVKKTDILKQALATCEGGLYINEFGKVILYADWPQSIPVALLNPQRIVKMTVNKSFARKADGYKVEYINQDEDFAVDTYRILRKGKSEEDADALEYTYTPAQFYLVTQYLQAAWLARRMQAKETLRPTETKITVGKEGRHYPVNSLIKVQHERFRMGIGNGEISALIYEDGKLAGLRTLERFDLAADKNYIVEYQATTPERNHVVKKQILSPGEYTNTLMFSAPEEPDSLDIPEIGNIISISLSAYEAALYLVGAGATETAEGFDLPLIAYDPDIYDSGPIPDYRSLLITEQPKVYDTFEKGIYNGLPGAAGNGVAAIAYKYRVTAVYAIPDKGWDDSGWLAAIPTMSATDKYLWRIERITYTSGATQDMVMLTAAYGNTGSPGSSATVYQLVPSANVIKRYNTGVVDPPKIACAQQSITGNGLPLESHKTLKYVTSANDESETEYTGPVSVGAWDWIEFRLYDGQTLLDRERTPVLSDGPPATRYELVPSVPLIVRDAAGAASPASITCSQQVVVGNNPPVASTKTIKHITSANATETVYTGAIAVAWDWIEFRLYDEDGVLLDQERVFVLSEGEPARSYELKPSASVIKVYNGAAEPATITCAQVSVTGNGLPVPSNKILKHTTSLDAEQPYTGGITVNPLWKWIDFTLYDEGPEGELVFLDGERVPVQKDGESPFYLDLENQHIPVRADEYGEPYSLPITTRATLYNGNTPIAYADFAAKAAEKQIARYPGSGGNIFDPMPGLFYPTRSAHWSVSQGATIDQNGVITIRELTTDTTDILVTVLYDDVAHTATLTLAKVKDGEAPIVIDIENENTSISCDVHGVPLPGELPLVTKAIFYKGTEKVLPGWFLENAPSGVTIAPDGTITVAENAFLGRSTNILVKAAHRGQVYSRMFTMAKAMEGEGPTVLDLLPDGEFIQCDHQGVPTGGLPLTVKARLHKGMLEMDAALGLEEAAKTDILYYPGSGENVFDPMAGGFYPVLSYPVVWALSNTPPGVTIDKYGLITVSGAAQLGDVNHVTVRATFHDEIYEAILTISKVRGGMLGKDGINGVTTYTWMKYSDNADGTGMYDLPTANTLYIGIAVNKTTAAASTNKADYQWSRFKGSDGVGATSYIWMRYADDAQGGGISNDGAGKAYIGFAYNKTTATESDNPADYSWSLILGENGVDGIPGPPGADGTPRYIWLRYSDNADGTGMYQLPNDNTIYIGFAYNKTNATESDNPGDYIWSRYRGADGTGVTLYTWMKYADDALGNGMSDSGVGKDYIGFAYNKTTATESDNPADYSWSNMRGDPATIPKYRGVVTGADTGNTGIVTISGASNKMNALDWVLFMGTSGWTKYYLYQWSGASWTKLSRERNVSKYADAIDDITADAPDGVFSEMFCKMLFAQQAAIETLQSQLIQILDGGAIFGGERFTRSGNIVVDNGADKQGFRLGADGMLQASNAEISGTLLANLQMQINKHDSLPMVGAIRAVAVGTFLVNGNFIGQRSSNIQTIKRLDQGKYLLIFQGDTESLLLQNCVVIGYYITEEGYNNPAPTGIDGLPLTSWINKGGMIMSIPHAVLYVEGAGYGIPISLKNNNNYEDGKIVVIVIG